MNNIYEVNFILSEKDPVINAGVMIANFNWNKANKANGIVGANDQGLDSNTPLNIKNSIGFPKSP